MPYDKNQKEAVVSVTDDHKYTRTVCDRGFLCSSLQFRHSTLFFFLTDSGKRNESLIKYQRLCKIKPHPLAPMGASHSWEDLTGHKGKTFHIENNQPLE